MTELCFVLAPGQNHFFVEIVEALRHELDALGVASSASTDGFPPMEPGRVYVLVPPHEYRAMAPRSTWPTPRQLERTVFYCFEQPGTFFFDEDVRMAWGPVGAVLDVNALSVDEFRRHGVRATHAPLGWTPAWSAVDLTEDPQPPATPPRDIDVLHLGIYSDRRGEALGRYAPLLDRWTSRLVLSDDHGPNATPQANYAMQQEKWSLLSRSRVLLNIHVGERAYFEWQRVVQAICNGALVVSEHSTGTAPLSVEQHFVSGRTDVLGLLAQPFLEDEARRAAMAREACLFLKREQPLSASAEVLSEVAESVASRPAGARAHQSALAPVDRPLDAATAAVARTVALRGLPSKGDPRADPSDADPASDDEVVPWPRRDTPEEARRPGLVLAFPDSSNAVDLHLATLRAGLKEARLDLARMGRALARMETEVRTGRAPALVRRVAQTTAWNGGGRRISVLTALYNYERHIGRALDTAANGSFDDLEFIVVDDGSYDDSVGATRRWMRAHDDVPVLLLHHPVNRSLGPARNTALDFARGELTFVLDADNEVYQHGVARLVAALDGDPQAAFAWGIAQRFSSAGTVKGLINVFPWQPWRFADGNFIDAMALWRTDVLRELGGFAEDLRLYGWEDYDLYCGVADRGLYGLHVPEIVARYRVSEHSMLSLTNLSVQSAVGLLIERHPELLGGVRGGRP